MSNDFDEIPEDEYDELVDTMAAMSTEDWPVFGGRWVAMGELVQALAKAQADFPVIHTNRTVKVYSKRTQDKYEYSYADMAHIVAATRPALTANGLAVMQVVEGPWMVTYLMHSAGAWVRNRVRLFPADTVHDYGSSLTYARRYGYKLLLGVEAGGEDDDGASANETSEASPAAKQRGERDMGSFTDNISFGKYSRAPDGPKSWQWVAEHDTDYLEYLVSTSTVPAIKDRCQKALAWAAKHSFGKLPVNPPAAAVAAEQERARKMPGGTMPIAKNEADEKFTDPAFEPSPIKEDFDGLGGSK